MPPKVKITKEEIIKTAIDLLRREGSGAVNARNIASELGCSTQPVFSNFSNMDELHEATTVAAYQLYLDFLTRECESGAYPKYKAFGMAYIRFAKEEKELFRYIFMRDRTGEDISTTEDFEASVRMISEANGISEDTARLIHMEMWAFVHGIATMLATSFLQLEWELISNMVSDVYHGVRQRHVSEGK